jgi:WD40 repeat protein
LPDSQCSRGLAFHGGHLAILCNDGSVRIRDVADLSKDVCVKDDSSEWCECAAYSPDGKYLAVGSHDNNIYVYEKESNYSLYCTLKAHTSYVTSLDWSCDSTYLRSVCGSYELLYFKLEDKA